MARAWVAALLLALPGVRADATDASAEAAANAAGVSTDVLASTLVTTLQNNLAVGEKRLIVMEGLPTFAESAVPKICTGTPAIVSHTPQNGPNGACFAGTAWEGTLQSNLSCTCLTYLSTTEWTFRIKNSASLVSKTEEKLPEKQPLDTEIEVDSTMIYGLSPTLKNLTILGVVMSRVPIKLMPSPVVATSDTVGLIISASRATVSTVHVENLDFGITSIGKGFVPSILTNLTLKNCNIKSFSTDLLTTSPSLVSLDLSSNALSGVFQDVTSTACASNGCDLQTLNLSSNHIKDFPTYLFNLPQLTSLSLLNNSLTNVSVDSSLYAKMSSGLQILELDTPVTCSQDEVMRAVASSKVCVLNATTQSTAAPAASQSGSSSTNVLIYGVIGGCLVIAVLVFVLVKKNSCRSQEQPDFGKEPLDAYFDNTLSYDDTHPTVSASLLNDPIIITNRIPYNDLRVANCISKGGFGLVYSGVYNRRRVAIKKIRPDRAGDIKMIEAFLKEICLMATLSHPHIVEFVGVSWDSLRNLCAVTEFMERGDLREVLHGFKLRNSPLTWDSHKTTIALHIAEGLTYLHSLSPKVIHRDLKSKNVLLNGEMEAKLSDFGISRERHLEETHMTAGIGTSFWIAPEVLLGKDYDERADIFSFGVVLSEIDTDDYPYWNASNPNVGNKAQENMILQMVASGAMRPSFSESCPKAVLELADLCLQVDPENRPTAAEVAYKLQQIVQFMNASSSRSSVFY